MIDIVTWWPKYDTHETTTVFNNGTKFYFEIFDFFLFVFDRQKWKHLEIADSYSTIQNK